MTNKGKAKRETSKRTDKTWLNNSVEKQITTTTTKENKKGQDIINHRYTRTNRQTNQEIQACVCPITPNFVPIPALIHCPEGERRTPWHSRIIHEIRFRKAVCKRGSERPKKRIERSLIVTISIKKGFDGIKVLNNDTKHSIIFQKNICIDKKHRVTTKNTSNNNKNTSFNDNTQITIQDYAIKKNREKNTKILFENKLTSNFLELISLAKRVYYVHKVERDVVCQWTHALDVGYPVSGLLASWTQARTIRTYMYAHMYTHTCTRVCTHMHARAYVHTYMQARMYINTSLCISVRSNYLNVCKHDSRTHTYKL